VSKLQVNKSKDKPNGLGWRTKSSEHWGDLSRVCHSLANEMPIGHCVKQCEPVWTTDRIEREQCGHFNMVKADNEFRKEPFSRIMSSEAKAFSDSISTCERISSRAHAVQYGLTIGIQSVCLLQGRRWKTWSRRNEFYASSQTVQSRDMSLFEFNGETRLALAPEERDGAVIIKLEIA